MNGVLLNGLYSPRYFSIIYKNVKECYVCKKLIRSGPPNPCYAIDNITEQILRQPPNKKEYEKWLFRKQQYKEWLDSKLYFCYHAKLQK